MSVVTSKMELFGTVFNSFCFLIIATKNSILDVADIPDPALITDIFALHQFEVNFGFLKKSFNQF